MPRRASKEKQSSWIFSLIIKIEGSLYASSLVIDAYILGFVISLIKILLAIKNLGSLGLAIVLALNNRAL